MHWGINTWKFLSLDVQLHSVELGHTSGLGMVAQTNICPPMPIVTFAVMTFLGASECLE